MSEVFKTTFSLSCSGALLIAVLFLLRPLLRSRLSKQWQYYIWLVVVARLLLPFAPETNLIGALFQNIDNRMVQTEHASQTGQSMPSAALPNGKLVENRWLDSPNGQPSSGGEQGSSPQSGLRTAVYNNLWLGWFLVALVLFIRRLTIYQSFLKYIHAGCVEVEDIELLERFGELVEQSRVKVQVELYTNSLISSPLLIGFFRPCIVLPTAGLSESDFRYTIIHELTHYKQRDMFYKWLVQIVVCVHWFNPLAWLVGRETERACELSCDEAVIKSLNASQRRGYGDTLVNAIGIGGCYKDSAASITLCESKEQLRERLDAITGFRKKSKLTVSFSVALTAAVCFGAVLAGAYTPAAETATAKPQTIGSLTLIQKEYTGNDLKKLGIIGITVNTLSDEVAVIRGGDTLKFEYYAEDQEEYTHERIGNYFNREGYFFCLNRSQSSSSEDKRAITITIPERFPLEWIDVSTTTGNINFTNCTAGELLASTQDGQIDIRDGSASKRLAVDTERGDALVAGTVLPAGGKGGSDAAFFHTESGTIVFQPADTSENYRFLIDFKDDYGEKARFQVNGVFYDETAEETELGAVSGSSSGGGVEAFRSVMKRKSKFTVHKSAGTDVHFTSPKGAMIVQDR